MEPPIPPDPAGDHDSRPEPPPRPAAEDCCRSGCDPCVFDLYDAALGRYEAELRAWHTRRDRQSGPR